MPIGQLLFSFQGRLNRQPWWIVSIIMIVILIVLFGALFAVAGLALLSGDLAALGLTGIVIIILYIPVLWISLALGAKRLHDRNKSAWWLLVFYVLPSVLNLIPAGEGGKMILSLAGLAIFIWALIELGFLRGTTGPNNYGPDPLAAA
jgi:uncharacterized membrane protein YhaH (DUF805 family)